MSSRINHKVKFNPIYDEKPDMLFDKYGVVPPVEGSVAAPSETTVKKFLNAEYRKARPRFFNPPSTAPLDIEDTLLETSTVGVYPVDGKKPFITEDPKKISNLSNDQITYTNTRRFAYAVSCRVLDFYKLSELSDDEMTDGELKKRFVKNKKRNRYKLPDKFLAMDVLICTNYFREELEEFLPENLLQWVTHLSETQHFRVNKDASGLDIVERSIRLLSPFSKKIRNQSGDEEWGSLEKKVGVYPLKRGRPFITKVKTRVSEDEMVYENADDFACAVATRLFQFYKLSKKDVDNKQLLTKKLVLNPKKKLYRLPESNLAMDVLICGKYCTPELVKYSSEKLARMFTELSIIKHFKAGMKPEKDPEKKSERIKKRKKIIDERAKEILLHL